MRIDYLTIFPDYFAPLQLSLPGRAAADGLVHFAVHDLRGWTHDRHRTVDDTPYGGGAGMVMRPEPWGEAFDELLADGGPATVLFMTPSGRRLDQALAHDLAGREHLVVACGRYEGIDQRVIDHAATRHGVEVVEVSIGDYVLNGGEVAALALTEAVVRLLPGFMGNAESLAEESHALATGGLLEYPVYTKPATWRGLEVPDVLRSGDHGRIASWRRQRSVERTVQRRPDLLPPSVLDDGGALVPAVLADAPDLLVLQRACWVQEALANDRLDIPTLHESLDDVRAGIEQWQTWVLRRSGRLVASVRGRSDGADEWEVGRVMVAPDLQGSGLGRALVEHIQATAPSSTRGFRLFTGAASERNQRLYRRAGFRLRPDLPAPPGAVVMTKQRRRAVDS